MNDERWRDIEFHGGKLTADEVSEGWHFCPDWDDMLIGPGMVELAHCLCSSVRAIPPKDRG